MDKRKSLGMIEKMLRIKVEANNIKWPPDCVGIFHQPKRPVKKI